MRAKLVTLVAAIALAGCAAEPEPSSSAFAGPTAAATTPSADERRSLAPTERLPTPSNLCDTGQLVPGTLARVNRDTVTRTGPGPHYEPTGSAEAMTAERLPDPYRVLAGDRVVVDDGPLRIGDVEWFLVYSAEVRGEGNFGAIVSTAASWAPVRDAEGSLFEPIDVPGTQCIFVAAGGPGRSTLAVPRDECPSGDVCHARALAWVAAAPLGEACRFLVTDQDSEEVVIEAEVIEWASGASWARALETRLIVDTDCTWSMRTAEA